MPEKAESIISEIEENVDTAHEQYRNAPPGPSDSDGGLAVNLDAANRSCLVGRIRNSGPVGLVRKVVHRILGSLISDINEFNSRIVRVLNVLMQDRDRRIAELEARIEKLEKQAGSGAEDA